LESVPVRVVDPPDEVEYMYDRALLRRHLTAGQRALTERERDEYRALRAGAELRRRANLRNSGLDVATLPHRGRTRTAIAGRAGVGSRTVQDAIKVRNHGDQDLVECVRTGNLSVEKAAREVRKRERYAEIGKAPPLPKDLFDSILADPPWWLSSAADHYPLMRTEEIAAMQVPAAETAILFLWEVTGMRADAMAVIDAWGFTFKTEIVWVKPSIGTGNWVRNRHEKLLIATRPATPTPSYLPDSVVEAPRGKHSEKPKIFHELIERMYPNAQRLELFARGTVPPGWTGWGNEHTP
jgi:N6-adenosine-specific RNA methylase IME4